jgi:hypothetical protein
VKFYTCWCDWRMPEQNKRAIAAHQVEHPTEQQRKTAQDRETLGRVVQAMDEGRPLGVVERMRALRTLLTADPGVVADEIFFKPILKQLKDVSDEEVSS